MHARPQRIIAFMCVAIAATSSPGLVHAAAKKPAEKSAPAPAQAQAAAPAGTDPVLCNSLTTTLMGKIAAMKAIEVGIAKDREKPAATLSGLFTEWSGGTYTGVAIKKKMKRMERERAMAVELNRLLASSGCAQVDIDAEMQKATAAPAVEEEARGENDPLAYDPLRGKLGR